MIYSPVTKIAIRICFDAHKDQLDKAGLPYVFHPYHLAEQMDTEHEICVALLHDVMEDTSITAVDLIAAGVPSEYVETCKLLTHADDVTYEEYIDALKDNPVARKVKIADLHHNLDIRRLNEEPNAWHLQRLEKYRAALDVLEHIGGLNT